MEIKRTLRPQFSFLVILTISLALILGFPTSILSQSDNASHLHIKKLLMTIRQNINAKIMENNGVFEQPRISIKNGYLRSIGAPPSYHFIVTEAVPNNPEATAKNFLKEHGKAFGIVSRAVDFKSLKVKMKGNRSYVRLQQTYSGLPVFGAEIIIQLTASGGVESVLSDIMTDTEALDWGELSVIPSVSASESQQAAMNLLADMKPSSELDATIPVLMIYEPSVVGNTGPTRLVWQMIVVSMRDRSVRELVLVDAHSGAIVIHFSQIMSAKYREIYDANNAGFDIDGTLARSEGEAATGTTDVDLAYEYMGDTYDFYFSHHGRDSIDADGLPLIGHVRYCSSNTNVNPNLDCPMPNAYWYGKILFGLIGTDHMYFGENYAGADDVVGHELTHGVTDHESSLQYSNQSGAINESFSDIWGEFIDLENGRGTDIPAYRWLLGEDLPSGFVRNMADPPAEGQPDRMGSLLWYIGSDDGGGVHTNSGVGNKLAYLLTDGDSFNGYQITGMGISAVADLFYEVQTNLLSSAADYGDLHSQLTQAAINLGWTWADRWNLEKACRAVEISHGIIDIRADNLIVNQWGSISVDIIAPEENDYYIRVWDDDGFTAPEWEWASVSSSVVSISRPTLTHTFTLSVKPTDPSEGFEFWLYKKNWLGLYEVIDKVEFTLTTSALSANAGGPYSAQKNIPTQLHGSASGGSGEYTFNWEIESVGSRSGQNPIVTFTSTGTYNVTLTVTDSSSDTAQDLTQVVVSTTQTPVLSVSTNYLDFGTIPAGDSSQETFSISNAGGGTLSWSIVPSQAFVSVVPQSGTNNATITVTVNTTGFQPGDSLPAHLTVNSNGGTEYINIIAYVGGDQLPDIRSGDVNPTTGYSGTTFTFTVDYGDGDNDPPTVAQLIIDGGAVIKTMTTNDFNYTDYSTFTVNVTGSEMGLGSHYFHFYFQNQGGSDRYPASGEVQGPIVNSGEPTMYVYDPDGIDDYVAKTVDPNYVIKWIANDPDGDPLTIALYYNMSRSTSGMTPINTNVPNTGTYTWNTSSVPNGTYYIYGTSNDGHGNTEDDWSTGTVTIYDSPANLPQEIWEDLQNISAGGQYADIAIGPYDEVHIVWNDGQVYYRKSPDGGYTWDNTKQISTSGSDAQEVAIAVDLSGNVHIVWSYDGQIYYEKLDNNGNTLIDETNISQSSSWTETPAIAVDPNGYIHVVWQDNRSMPADIRYRRSTNGGSSWDGSLEIGTGGSNEVSYPAVAADSNNVYVAFTNQSGDAVNFVKSSNSGASWGSPAQVISVDSPKYASLSYFDNTLHLVHRYPNGVYYHKSTNGGSSWGIQTALPCFPSTASFPGVAADASGVYVTHNTGYFGESLDGGNQWSSEVNIGVGGNNWTRIAVDSSGEIHVVAGFGGVRYRRTVTPACPTVQGVSPLSGQSLVNSTYTITWTATDPNPGDTLTINLYYDTDNSGPANRVLIASGEVNDGVFDWDVFTVPRGTYYVYVEANDGECTQGSYSNGQVIVNHPPVIIVNEPDGVDDTADISYTIRWTGSDPDGGASLSVDLYYDGDTDPASKVPISLGESNVGTFIWDTSSVPEGNYYIYAVIHDGVNAPVGDYSNGTVTIDHPNVPPIIAGLPDQALTENGSIEDAFDLNDYASDLETPDSGLVYSIVGNTNSNCGVSIDSNGRIDIHPAANWYGQSDVTIQASDGEDFDTDTFRIAVLPLDTDEDGLPDDWETEYFGDLSQGPDADNDGDGLNNIGEYQHGTDPTNPDTDSDQMPDGWEAQYGLNPLDPSDAQDDADRDGYTNLDEYLDGTDPTVPNCLNLITPNGGEAIPSGSKYTIQWAAPPDAVSFKLSYSMDKGTTWKSIVNGVNGTSYDWTVPIPGNNKRKCLLRVIGYNASGLKMGVNKSDSTFTIEVVRVTSPNGGEALTSGSGSTTDVTWATNETKRAVAKVRLYYTINGGTTWNPMTTLTGNPRSYPWLLPAVGTPKTKCKVKVVLKDVSGNTVGSDISDDYFAIQLSP